MVKIIRVTPENPDFLGLVDLLDEDLWKRYPETQKNYTVYNAVSMEMNVVIAYKDNKPAGCGCFKDVLDKSAEIKRMFVKNEFRGMGIAKGILAEIEKWAIEEGKERLILETGNKQPEAIALYTKIGFAEIEKFGPYVNNSESVCMGKKI